MGKSREKQMLEDYFLVCRCWQDPKAAKKHKMTSEKAIKVLGEVKQSVSPSLKRRAQKLLHDIIHNQDEPEYLKA